MQVIILSGGLGTRLRPRTLAIPKPMAPVRGRPFLSYQLDYLKRQGIRRALLLTGYLGEQIEEYFGDGRGMGMELTYSREETPMGTAGALKLAEDKIHSDFILIYGDSFLPLNYSAFEEAFKKTGVEGMVVVYKDAHNLTGVKNNVRVAPDWRMTCYDKSGSSPGLDFIEAGVLAFRSSVLRRILPGHAVSLEEEIYPALLRGGELAAYVTQKRFFDIGTEARLRQFEEWVKNDHFKDTVQD